MGQKLMKQFNTVIDNIARQEDEWDTSQPVAFDLVGSILTTMGFLPDNLDNQHIDYGLFEEFYELMEGTAREGVKLDDLAYLLKVIRGFRDPDIEIECDAPEDKQGIFRMTLFDVDGNFIIRKGGSAKIASHFRSFYINKLQSESQKSYPRVGKPAEIASEKELSKRVQLSQKTEQYAL